MAEPSRHQGAHALPDLRGSAPSPAPATTTPGAAPPTRNTPALSPTRPPYIPQFSAATQMILQRMRGEQSSLSSALASASAATSRTSIQQSTYEDVRRRVAMSMTTSSGLSMTMPAPAPSTAPAATSALRTGLDKQPRQAEPLGKTPGKPSAIRKLPAIAPKGSAAASKAAAEAASGLDRAKAALEKIKSKGRGGPRAGGKRKRGRGDIDSDGDASDTSSLSDPFSSDNKAGGKPSPAASTPLTTTKSGRQVLKPTTYDPAAMDAAGTRRRSHYGKRTAEQQLCKVCTRLASPDSNQMVFCDGCNDGWHQMCHDPWIGDEYVRDASRTWFCAGCTAKMEKDKPAAKKKATAAAVASLNGEASAAYLVPQTPGQKRAFLSNLPKEELVDLLARAWEQSPSLPVFQKLGPPAPPAGMPRSLFAGSNTDGLFSRFEANPNGPVNFIRKIPAGAVAATAAGSPPGKGRSPAGSKSGGGKAAAPAKAVEHRQDVEDEREDSPFAPPWPKPGKGLYNTLPPEAEDDKWLADDQDYEAFSSIVYDGKGNKVSENGMKV